MNTRALTTAKTPSLAERMEIDVATAAARVDELLAIWRADLDVAPAGDLRPLRDTAAAAIRSGQVVQLGLALERAATDMEVAAAMAELLASFLPKKDADLRTFSRMLVQDVVATRASPAALLAACTAIRRGCTFMPSIAEVCEAIEAQKSACAARAALLARLARRVVEVDRILETAKAAP